MNIAVGVSGHEGMRMFGRALDVQPHRHREFAGKCGQHKIAHTQAGRSTLTVRLPAAWPVLMHFQNRKLVFSRVICSMV